MNKKPYIKPCVKEVYILTEPISLGIAGSVEAMEDACSKSFNDDSGSGSSGIWDAMESDEADEEE